MLPISRIDIKNFKSLRNVTIDNCKTFNLLIGRPNVGKSNIIEALSFFAAPYLVQQKIPFSEFLRVKQTPALFFNGDISNPIDVQVGEQNLHIAAKSVTELSVSVKIDGKTTSFDSVDLKVKKSPDYYPIIKPYKYTDAFQQLPKVNVPFLCPIYGSNMMQIVQQNKLIKDYFVSLLKEYNLQLTFDMAQQELRILKPLSDTSSFILPYSALADTIKRLMFYKAAVESNTDSIVLFEELEAHAFPPFISMITRSIIDRPENQYFITTHSPYVVNDFLEYTRTDVAIHLVDFRDGETFVKTLSQDEIQEVYNYGVDLFFNAESFLR